MPNIGPTELIIVLVIALLILGPKRLPAAGRSLGRGMREFRDGITGRDAPAAQIDPASRPVSVAPSTTASHPTSEGATDQHVAAP